MFTSAAEKHFGGRKGIARVLAGIRSTAAVYLWGDVVPRAAAKRLEALSNNQVPVDESLYDEHGKIARKQESVAA